MKLTLDFDNNTVTSEQGTISVPGLSEKKSDILNILELTEIQMTNLKRMSAKEYLRGHTL